MAGGRGRPGGQPLRYPPPAATTAADANFGEYSGGNGGGGGGHPIGACHVCPLHSPAKRRAISIKKRVVAVEHPTMTTTTDDGKKNGNFNFPPQNGPAAAAAVGPGNELSCKSGDGGDDDDCGGKANGCSVTSASSVGEE